MLIGSLKDPKLTLTMPSVVSQVLALVAGAVQVVLAVLISLPADWRTLLQVLLVVFAGIGISPLVGTQFRAALHLPPWLGYLITVALSGLAVLVSALSMPDAVHGAILAVVTITAGLGFAPSLPTVQLAKPRLRGVVRFGP